MADKSQPATVTQPIAGLPYHITPGKQVNGQPLIVPNPERANQPLPPHGAVAVWTTYWERLLRDGDIAVTQPQ